MSRGRRRPAERGFALLAVLWVVALLSVIAVSLMSSGSLSFHMARNAARQARNEALAEAGITRAILGLMDSRPERRWRVDGVPAEFSFGEASLTISVQDQLGLIDLNAADEDLLIGLFRSVGLSEKEASAVVDDILDWRDAKEARRPNAAKAADYRAAGYDYGPRNGPFQSVDELKLVKGLSPTLFAAVLPAITVYSGRSSIDPLVAPKQALMALPSLDRQRVESILGERATASLSNTTTATVTQQRVFAPFPMPAGRTFQVKAEAADRETRSRREAVVRFTGDASRPYLVLIWK